MTERSQGEIKELGVIIGLLSDCRFDELFVDKDNVKFNLFLKENVLDGNKFAVSFPVTEGLVYLVYPVERIEFNEKSSVIQFGGELTAIVPNEKHEDKPEEIIGLPVFPMSETDIWREVNG